MNRSEFRQCILLCVMFLTLAGPNSSYADEHDDAKRKITDRFEVVTFGETLGIFKEVEHFAEGVGEYFDIDHDNESVIVKRLAAAGVDWSNVKKNFEQNNVDWKKEPIYLGRIDWSAKSHLGKWKFTSDHKFQGYVAARKKSHSRSAALPKEATYVVIAPKNKFDGWFLDIDGNADFESLKSHTVSRNLLICQDAGPSWSIENGKNGGAKLRLVAPNNKFHGWYLDIDGNAPSEPLKNEEVSRNVLLTQDNGVEWEAEKGPNGGLVLRLVAPRNGFDGWYLDIDGNADAQDLKRHSISRNLLIRKDDGLEWNAR